MTLNVAQKILKLILVLVLWFMNKIRDLFGCLEQLFPLGLLHSRLIIKFIEFFNRALHLSLWKRLIILSFLPFFQLILKLFLLKLILFNNSLKFLFKISALQFIPFILFVDLVLLPIALRIIQKLFLHHELPILVEFDCKILNESLFLHQFASMILLNLLYSFVRSLWEYLYLLSLDKDLVFEVTDDVL